jgi:RNA recognition motif-containing protein
MSVRLYVGNLPEAVTRQELDEVFAALGEAVSAKLITDRKTGKCRGFGFLTVPTEEMADQLIEKFNGHPFKDGTLRLELAQPKTPAAAAKPAPAEKEAPTLAARPVDEARKPRPVKASTPVLRAEKPVSVEGTGVTEATEALTPRAADEPRKPAPVRPTAPVRRTSAQTPARPAAERTQTRRTPATASTNRASENRRQGNTMKSVVSSTSFHDWAEAGVTDPRWAVLLEAKKKLELMV